MFFSNKLFNKVFAVLVVGLLFATSAIIPLPGLATNASSRATAPQQTEEPADEEHLLDQREDVRLSWDGIRDDGSVVNARGANLRLRVENLTAVPLNLELTTRADDGGVRNPNLKLGTVRLEPFDNAQVPLNLLRFGFNLSGVIFSGRVQATARVLDDAGNYVATGIAPPVFFHPTSPSSVAFYGKQALQEQFNGGDFRGRAARDLAGDTEGAILTRVMDVGAGNASEASFREAQAKVAEDANDGDIPRIGANSAEAAESFNLKTEAPEASAANKFRTCILFRIQTTDSGGTIDNGPNKGGTEDHWANANAGIDVPAYGVHVKIKKNGVETTYATEPSTGCFNWSHDASGQFLLTAYGYASNSRGSYVRIHNNVNDFSSYPGTTYRLAGYITPSTNGTQYYAFGNYDSEWTAMAAAAFTLFRYPGVYGKAYHMAIDNTSGGYSSAHWSSSNTSITSGRHYLRIDNVDEDGGSPQSQQKAVVAHEMGHAIAALFYGHQPGAKNGSEPNVKADHNVTPDGCTDPNVPANSYAIFTKEWNSLGFREGFATFIAAKVWNNKDYEGALNWMGTQLDLERFRNGLGTTGGGRLENFCCTGNVCAESWKDAGTNEDWVLFFWDLYTNKDDECTQQPSLDGMLVLYSTTRFRPGLAHNNYFDKMREAVNIAWPQSCLAEQRFDVYAVHNGINN